MAVAELFQHVTDLATSDTDGPRWPAHGAVVALLDASDQLLQLLTTQNLRRAMVQRLKNPGQNGPKRPRADLRGVTRRVAWTPVYSQFEAAWRYLNLSRLLMPNDYRKQLGFKPSWFVGLDMGERHPRWTASDTAYERPVEFGPFASRRKALGFIKRLEDLFDLCRRHEILVEAPHGKACAYFDMGQCPAPCNGSISMAEYRTQLDRSIEFAAANGDARLEIVRREMRASASLMNFERAGRLKGFLGLGENSSSQAVDYREEMSQLNKLRILVLQKGSARKRVKLFTFENGALREHEEVILDNLGNFIATWWQRSSFTSDASGDDRAARNETISLVAQFMRRRVAAAGLWLPQSSARTLEELTERATQFARLKLVR